VTSEEYIQLRNPDLPVANVSLHGSKASSLILNLNMFFIIVFVLYNVNY